MLYWICPECGHECSPAIRECPTCTTAEIVSLAQSFQSPLPHPARPSTQETAQPAISPLPATVATPRIVAAENPQAECGLKAAGLSPIREVAFQAAPSPQAHWQAVQPAPIAPEARSLAFISSKLKLAGTSLSDLEQAGVQAIMASFQEQPAASLLCGAPEIVTAPAPPAEQWLRSPKIAFTAKAPGNSAAILAASPQPPTLAGPCLPPQLQRFTANPTVNQRPAGRRASAPTWMLSVLAAIVLLLGVGTLFQYVSVNRGAKAASVAPEPTRTPAPAAVPAPPIHVAVEHPAARFVEVAGVRVVTAPNRKAQLQYIVINHSASELTGLNIHIALHSADAPTGAPLIRVSSIVPSIEANQSKEIRTDLDAGLNAASIPDWPSLRAEILVARQ